MASPVPSPPEDPSRLRAGTIQYTRAGLVTLFLYMLWGDFCFTMMELIIPRLLPVQLQGLGASNFLIGLLSGSVASAMNLFINPIISFRSDRFRSRWGRRIPFLFWPTPFLVLFLILLGFAEPIGIWLKDATFLSSCGLTSTGITLGFAGVMVICFQFFNMFVSSVFYYLFNDVVPEAFLGRFMALFRVVGMLAGFVFHTFIFGWATTHLTTIYVALALLYLVAFWLMCWKVKEPEYPPPPADKDPGLAGSVRTYFRECYSHKYYLTFFLAVSLWMMSGAGVTFQVFFGDSLGMSRADFGKLTGVTALLSALLLYPLGSLVDKFHPLRVALVAGAITAPAQLLYFFFVHTPTAYWIATLMIVPIGVAYFAASLPMMMAILPRERYGQFCSAQAVIGSLGMMIANAAAGWLIDATGDNPRFLWIWMFACQGAAVLLLVPVYRMWCSYGGSVHYLPPDTTRNLQTSPGTT